MIHLQVNSLAGEALAVVNVSTSMSIANLKMQIARKVDMEGCRFVRWLTHGSEVLEDDMLLLESNLCDGDELVATCTSLAVGEYEESYARCLSGEWETWTKARVTLSADGSAVISRSFLFDSSTAIREFYGNSPVFCDICYALGDVMCGPDGMDVPVDFLGKCWIDGDKSTEREIRWHGALHIDATDLTERRLRIPDMDWNMVDVEFMKPKYERFWNSVREFESQRELEREWLDIGFEADEQDLPKFSRRGAKKSPQIKDSKARIRACEAREQRRQKCIRILKEKDRKCSRDKRFNGLGEF